MAQQRESVLVRLLADEVRQTGFHPFDSLAVVYVTLLAHFTCKPTLARIGFSYFLVLFGLGYDLEIEESL